MDRWRDPRDRFLFSVCLEKETGVCVTAFSVISESPGVPRYARNKAGNGLRCSGSCRHTRCVVRRRVSCRSLRGSIEKGCGREALPEPYFGTLAALPLAVACSENFLGTMRWLLCDDVNEKSRILFSLFLTACLPRRWRRRWALRVLS